MNAHLQTMRPRMAQSTFSTALLVVLVSIAVAALPGCSSGGDEYPVWSGHDPNLSASDFEQRGSGAPISSSGPAPQAVELTPVPRALTAFPGDESATVRWWPVEGAEGYVLYRGTSVGSTPHDAERFELAEPGWVDEEIPDGAVRAYAVAAIIDGEEGALSGEVITEGVAAVGPRRFHVHMESSDLERLYSRSRYSDERLPADLFVEPENVGLETRGMRFRGAGSRRYPKFGFNVRLETRPAFNFATQHRRGGDRLLLNAMWTDPSSLRDTIAYDMYHELGLPAPRTYYSELYLNDVYEGFYVNFERIDRELLRQNQLHSLHGDFTLVRDNMKSMRRELDMEELRTAYSLNFDDMFDSDEERIEFLQRLLEWRGEMEDQNWEALLDLVRWAHHAMPGEAFAAEFRERYHADDLIDFLAIHIISLDTDSLDEDYWWYMDERDGRWRWIPWDKNLVFGSGWYGDFLGSNDFFRYDRTFLPTLNNQVVIKLLETRSLYRQLQERTLELMETTYTRDWMEARIRHWLPHLVTSMDRHAEPGTFEHHGQQHHGEIGYMPHHHEQIAEFMDLRRFWLIKEFERRANNLSGSSDRARLNDVGLAAGTRSCAVDRFGRTLACIRPDSNWRGSWRAEVLEDSDVDGVERRWHIGFSHDFEGRVTFYYANAPNRNWLDQPEEEEEWAGEQWHLDTIHTAPGGEAQRLRTRVNPYANMVKADLAVEAGVHTFTLPFGP